MAQELNPVIHKNSPMPYPKGIERVAGDRREAGATELKGVTKKAQKTAFEAGRT